MTRPTKQEIAHRLDAEWERLCRAAAKTAVAENSAQRDMTLEIPQAVRSRVLGAWRCSLARTLPPSAPRDILLLMAGALGVACLLRW